MAEHEGPYQYSRIGSQQFAAPPVSASTTDDALEDRASQSYRHSTMMRTSESGNSATDVFVRGSLLDRNIEAVDMAAVGKRVERSRDYKGRRKVWKVISM